MDVGKDAVQFYVFYCFILFYASVRVPSVQFTTLNKNMQLHKNE